MLYAATRNLINFPIIFMRPLEILLTLLLVTCTMLPLVYRGRGAAWAGIAVLGALGLHIFLEGWRWQMIPLCGIALGLGIYALWRLATLNSGGGALTMGGYTTIIGGLILLGVAAIPPIVLPIPKLPKPTGPYAVGTVNLMLVDESRPELYSGNQGEPRAIMVQIWYPAEAISRNTKPAPWIDRSDIIAPRLADMLNKPHFFFDHVRYARASALPHAPLARAEIQYPLLLFSHGWSGFRTQSTFLMEELASYGYIVAAPDHTYGALVTVFPDGRAAENNPATLPHEAGISEAEYQAAARRLGAQWAADLSFILDALQDPAPDSPAAGLRHRIDFSRTGAMGHSTGGGAAIQFCAIDPRCKAILGMDPYMIPVDSSVVENGISQPCAGIFSAVWAQDRPSGNNKIFERFAARSKGNFRRYFIKQTAHYDFTDIGSFSSLSAQLGLTGPLNDEQVQRIVRAYALAFFDVTLRGMETPILDTAAFPEIISWEIPR